MSAVVFNLRRDSIESYKEGVPHAMASSIDECFSDLRGITTAADRGNHEHGSYDQGVEMRTKARHAANTAEGSRARDTLQMWQRARTLKPCTQESHVWTVCALKTCTLGYEKALEVSTTATSFLQFFFNILQKL